MSEAALIEQSHTVRLRALIEQQYQSRPTGCGVSFGEILCWEIHSNGMTFVWLAEKWGISLATLGELICDHCKRLEPEPIVNHSIDAPPASQPSPAATVSPDRPLCNECGWQGDREDLLEAAHPFEPVGTTVFGCPSCREIITIEPPGASVGTKLASSEPLGPHYDGTTMDNQQLDGTTRRNQPVVTAGETAPFCEACSGTIEDHHPECMYFVASAHNGSFADTADVRWAVNVLLEKIAAKFEGWDTFDVFRSEAAATVRSFKHDLSSEPPQTLPGKIAAIYGNLNAEDCATVDREWARQRGYILPTDGTSQLTRPESRP